MTNNTKAQTAKILFYLGIVLIIFGTIINLLVTEAPPEMEHLDKAEGTLRFVKKVDNQRYGSDVIHFGLTGIDEEFHYNSKSGTLDKVYKAT